VVVRDREGRRQRIVEAAAELMCGGHSGKLTHRMVAEKAGVPLGSTTYYFDTLDDLNTAAIEYLTAKVEHDLADLADELAHGDHSPAGLAAYFDTYLQDTDNVATETAIYTAGLQRPELRELSRTWFNGLVDILTPYTGPQAATMLAVFADGAILYAALHDRRLPVSWIEHLVRIISEGESQ
jgi:DNA-binding transcriptional regulator YbjK